MASSNPDVVIETVKRAESGAGTVVRLYESRGRPATTTLTTRVPHTRATLTDLLERPLGPAELDRLEFGPFQLVTVLLEP